MSYFRVPIDMYGNPLPFAVPGGIMIPIHREPSGITIRCEPSRVPKNYQHGGYCERVILPKPVQQVGRLSYRTQTSNNDVGPHVKMICALNTLKRNVPYIMERTSNSSSRTTWYEDALRLINEVENYDNNPPSHDDRTSMNYFRLLSVLVQEGNEVLLCR